MTKQAKELNDRINAYEERKRNEQAFIVSLFDRIELTAHAYHSWERDINTSVINCSVMKRIVDH